MWIMWIDDLDKCSERTSSRYTYHVFNLIVGNIRLIKLNALIDKWENI